MLYILFIISSVFFIAAIVLLIGAIFNIKKIRQKKNGTFRTRKRTALLALISFILSFVFIMILGFNAPPSIKKQVSTDPVKKEQAVEKNSSSPTTVKPPKKELDIVTIGSTVKQFNKEYGDGKEVNSMQRSYYNDDIIISAIEGDMIYNITLQANQRTHAIRYSTNKFIPTDSQKISETETKDDLDISTETKYHSNTLADVYPKSNGNFTVIERFSPKYGTINGAVISF